MSTMHAVVELVAGLDPAFRFHIRGASEKEIAALEALAGRPLPEVYRDFLSVLGKDMDWLAVGDVDFRIETVLRAHRSPAWSPPPEYLKIGVDRHYLHFDAYLEILEGRPPAVVRFPAGEGLSFSEVRRFQLKRVAGSLEEMLCLPVFKMYRFDRLPFQARYVVRGPAASLIEISRLASGERFQWLWFSSPSAHAYERDDAVLIAKELGTATSTLAVATLEPEELVRLGRRLTAKLGAVSLPAAPVAG